MVEIFKALSEESRLRILSLLLDREMCVCEIEFCLEMSQSNASRHLTVLKQCGILDYYKKAQWAYYRINDTFKQENIELWDYLLVKLKQLPTYQLDYEKSKNCSNDICDK
ncbi:metalloregulator ArsR/SmtB family transcription factor [Anaerocolumna sedimenticola]|uniref:Metalloregulator ArsR/SmtB family transcription factor n=1 Tax=Anaerocolumna sedimenticola TaxID=2696063 RepID=A0A6P1TRB9_9FIRM|nr:metalloregulator ArsR/SmtB family transcription factor [Anaerocolumna sedimenticola]QHQ62286.1 metalloregulator ArsR/SmtB family transcription factor [Anaerocolumna sedimenticola]